MSERERSGKGWAVAAAGAALLVGIAIAGNDPSTPFVDESRSCTPEEMLPYEECKDGHPYCPAPKVCAVESSTTSVVATIVPDAPESTEMPPLATLPPETTVVPMQQRPSSEAAPKPTEAPATVPPETSPPATEPPATAAPETSPPATAPRPQRTDRCGSQTYTVQSGDGWTLIARKLNVSARALASANGTTVEGALWPGDVLCAPAGSSNTTPETAPPTTITQQPPSTAAPTTAASATTQPRRPPGSERTTTTIKPVWVQATQAPTTTKAAPLPPKQPQQPPSPVTTRPGPGTVRTTVPPCPGC